MVKLDGMQQGFYVSAFGGIDYLPKTSYRITAGSPDLLKVKATYNNPARTWGLAFGYQYNAFRMELAVSKITADIDHENIIFDPPLPFILDPSGDRNSVAYTYMLNTYYSLIPNAQLTPYLGAGLGYLYLYSDLSSRAVSSMEAGSVIFFPDAFRSSGFVYQAVVGLLYHFTSHWDLYLDYRYLGDFSLSTAEKRGDDLQNRIEKFRPKYSGNLIILGITYKMVL